MEWIKTREQQPKIAQKCLITVDDPIYDYSIIIAQYTQYGNFYLSNWHTYISKKDVDYWMPLPKIPKPLNLYKVGR